MFQVFTSMLSKLYDRCSRTSTSPWTSTGVAHLKVAGYIDQRG